ncbi:hypothetical protein EDC01DRAFT_777472 [Geopyxis carbonaria]|nr:hypothetical protein EDC01DRAFT_777472 [Geopyxis carbonaria]
MTFDITTLTTSQLLTYLPIIALVLRVALIYWQQRWLLAHAEKVEAEEVVNGGVAKTVYHEDETVQKRRKKEEGDGLSTTEWRGLATLGPRVYPGISQ